MNPLIEIKRQRIFIDHSSNAKTFINEEFTIRSLQDKIDNIIIIKNNFMPNLHVYDSDAEELPIVNNTVTLDLLERQKSSPECDAETKQKLESFITRMKNKKIYVIWIKLPPIKKMKKNQLKVINFEYDATKDTKPSSKIRTNYQRNLGHSVFFIIKKPEDYDFKGKPQIGWTNNNDDYAILNDWNGKNSNTIRVTETAYTLSLTIKPKTVKTATVTYSFTGTRNIISFPLIAVTLLSIFAFSILILHQCSFFQVCDTFHISVTDNSSTILTVNDLLEKRIELLSATAAASLVIPRLISNPNIRNDYKYFFLIPLGLSILAFF